MSLDAVLLRRSIRQYTSQAVSDEIVEQLLQAAMSAPSAGNQQPWHFVVIRDRLILNEIPKIHPYAEMVRQAQAAILVCGERALEKHQGYWVQDCSAATENILIAVQALGLGAVWVGIYPRENRVDQFRTLFGIPEKITPFALIPLGYPAERKERAQRYLPSRVHRNQWGA